MVWWSCLEGVIDCGFVLLWQRRFYATRTNKNIMAGAATASTAASRSWFNVEDAVRVMLSFLPDGASLGACAATCRLWRSLLSGSYGDELVLRLCLSRWRAWGHWLPPPPPPSPPSSAAASSSAATTTASSSTTHEFVHPAVLLGLGATGTTARRTAQHSLRETILAHGPRRVYARRSARERVARELLAVVCEDPLKRQGALEAIAHTLRGDVAEVVQAHLRDAAARGLYSVEYHMQATLRALRESKLQACVVWAKKGEWAYEVTLHY